MDLLLYIAISAVYIMVVHFAIGIKKQFNLLLMGGFFVLGAAMGWWMHSYETGLVLAVILSLIFW